MANILKTVVYFQLLFATGYFCPPPVIAKCENSSDKCIFGTDMVPPTFERCNVTCQKKGFKTGECLISPNSICPCHLIITHCICSYIGATVDTNTPQPTTSTSTSTFTSATTFQPTTAFSVATVEPEISNSITTTMPTITTEPIHVSPLDPPSSLPDSTETTPDPLLDPPFSTPRTPKYASTNTPELTTSTSTYTFTSTRRSRPTTACPLIEKLKCLAYLDMVCIPGTAELVTGTLESCKVTCKKKGFKNGKCFSTPNSVCACNLNIFICICSH